MCVELLCKPKEKWVMKYVAGAVAVTDVPNTLLDLLKQVSHPFGLGQCGEGSLTPLFACLCVCACDSAGGG